MNAFFKTGLYLACHFALYAVILRQLRIFGREGSIFLYHALSAVVLLLVLVTAFNLPAVIAGCLSMHGIYSLSFLELWSLAEGGYSLSILRRVRGASESDETREWLEQIGTIKRAKRIESLIRLNLVTRVGGAIRITRAGRAVAFGLGLVAALTQLEQVG